MSATTTQPGAGPNPAIIFDLLMAHQRSAALRSAIELDIFRALGEGPADAATLAGRCSASERGIRILGDFLTIVGLISKEHGVYSHTPTSAVFLDPRSPACLGSIARFMSNPAMQEPFGHLTEIVRSGRTSLPGEGSVEAENPVWVEFAHSMAPMMMPATGPLATVVLSGLTGPVRVLDIAAGHGLFGIEVARVNPEAEIVAQDWAPVLEVAHANAAKAGVADRLSGLPGSAFDVDFDGPYDIVLLTNFLHHFDRATCVTLLKKVYAALKPGGRAATLDFVPNEDRVSPPMPASFALTMLASTAAGDAYTFSEYDSMYREAGFVHTTAYPVPPTPQTIVMGERPA
ncbi:MAG TPA: class I SAM-dependent methyltransferase [Candidatus Acidoferrum sp.]|nr:class I SAM-dependent methyltransferase [Candidatus Acidoferrum sp.]